MQDQVWNKARPELIELFLKPLHALTERYAGKVVLGEISGDDALLRAAEYTNGGGLDIAYSFDLLSCPGTPKGIRDTVARLEKTLAEGWGCWSLSNHDVHRAVTRWGGCSIVPAPPSAVGDHESAARCTGQMESVVCGG